MPPTLVVRLGKNDPAACLSTSPPSQSPIDITYARSVCGRALKGQIEYILNTAMGKMKLPKSVETRYGSGFVKVLNL